MTIGSYVPPHKRHLKEGAEAKVPPPPPPSSGGAINNHNHSRQGNHHQQQQQGRPRNHSPRRNNNNNNHNNNNNRNHSPKRHNNNNNNTPKANSPNRKDNRKHSNSPTRNNHHQHHHHHVVDKEQLHHQQEQLKRMKDCLTRICCINLERRADRWTSFQQHLQQSLGRKIGHSLLTNKIERINAVDGIPDSAAVAHVQTTWDATINAQWDRHIEVPFDHKEMAAGEVGCALSHVKLWQELAESVPAAAVGAVEGITAAMQEATTTMMILEDDALFYSPRMAHVGETPPPATPTGTAPTGGGGTSPKHPGRKNHPSTPTNHHHSTPHPAHPSQSPTPAPITVANHDFLTAFQLAWTQLPEDWDIWYLGFSDRGDRLPVDDFHIPKTHHHDPTAPSLQIQLFRPTYGFHTHGYVLNVKAAKTLTANLPVQGPLDVWLADNQWFGLQVYCSVIANEGWKNTGAWLITQNRKPLANNNHNNTGNRTNYKDSDIHQSGRKNHNTNTNTTNNVNADN